MFDGFVEAGGVATAIAMSDDYGALNRLGLWHGDPCADADALPGVVVYLIKMKVGVGAFDLRLLDIEWDLPRLCIGFLPKVFEIVGFGGGGDLQQIFERVAVCGVERKIVCYHWSEMIGMLFKGNPSSIMINFAALACCE